MGQFFFRKTAPFMPLTRGNTRLLKYIKENNERFSTLGRYTATRWISISRRIMKDSQLGQRHRHGCSKYIKENNERFSTDGSNPVLAG